MVIRIVVVIVAALLILAGGVWFLQGINVLPGSFMTGSSRWALYGSILIVIGIALLLVALVRRNRGTRR